MTVTYFQRSTTSDLTGPAGTGGTTRHLVASRTAGGASADLITGNMNAGLFCNQNFFTPADDPGLNGAIGNFTVPVRITVQNANIAIRVFLGRVLAGGTLQGTEIEATEGAQTAGAATRTFTWTGLNQESWASTDRLRIRVQLTNTSGLMNQSATIAVDTSADTIDTPFSSGAFTVGGFTGFYRKSRTAVDGTNHTVLLPDGSNVSGRLVLVVFSVDGSTITWPSSPEFLQVGNVGVTGAVIAAAYRFIDGTESGFDGTDDSIVVAMSGSEQSNAHVFTFTDGHHASTPPEAATATGSGANADPPSLNPAGWDVEAALWVAAAATRFNALFSVAPVSYTELLHSGGGPANGDDNASLGTALRELSAASEDPGTFTSGDGGLWVSMTVAVRPAGTGGAVALAATLDTVSDMQASLGLALSLAATLDSVSDNQASLGLAVPLAATLDAVSDQQAFLRLALPLAASMDLVSNQSADLSVTLAGTNLEAVMNAVSDIQASLGIALPLAATVDSVSSQTGFLGLALPLAANLDAVSDQTAFLRLALPLVATLDAVSAMTADLAVQGETLTAFMDAVSDIQASLGLQLPLEATVNTVSDQQASLRLALGLAANMDSVTDQQAILGLQITLAAQLDSVSDMLADLDVFLPGLLQVKFGVLRRRYGVRVVTRRYAAGVVTRRYGAGELRREP
jgi:hypothetical protein